MARNTNGAASRQPWAVEALAALQAEREQLQARLAQIDAGIAAIQTIAGGGAVTPTGANGDAARPTRASSDRESAVLAALKAGATSPLTIAEHTNISTWAVKAMLRDLLASKAVKKAGNRRSVTYSLA